MPGRFTGSGEGNFREAEFPLDDQLDSISSYKNRYFPHGNQVVLLR